MEIGDKVKFNKYVPISENGVVKTITVPHTFTHMDLEMHIIGTETRMRKIWPWEYTRNNEARTISWDIRKFNTEEKEGIYIGSLRKKLSRSYRLTEERSPEVGIRNRPLNWTIRPSGNGLLDQILDNNAITSQRPHNWTTRNPRRIDNPNQLEELAIIAVSKTKRYVVHMKDIIEYNIKSKIKII